MGRLNESPCLARDGRGRVCCYTADHETRSGLPHRFVEEAPGPYARSQLESEFKRQRLHSQRDKRRNKAMRILARRHPQELNDIMHAIERWERDT